MPIKTSNFGFTIEFLLDKIKNEEDQNVDLSNLKSYEFRKFDAGDAFMSEIVQLKFEWYNKTSLKSVILKIPGYQNPTHEDNVEPAIEFLEKAHTRECEFYELFASPKIPLKLPKYYYGSPYSRHTTDGLIIMEDLSESSRTVGMLPGFSNLQTEALMVELGKITAASLLDRSWVEQLSIELHCAEAFLLDTKQIGCQLKEIKPEWFNGLIDELAPAYDIEHFHDCFYAGTKFGIPASIVHADLWSANVLWEKDARGKATSKLSSIIDWQSCHTGNPAADLARSLSLNTPSKYRHENEERLLKIYYDSVNGSMNGKIPFTFDQLKKAYKASFPYVSTYTGFGAPMYYKMGSVVGDPNDPTLQDELLDRVRVFFQDTVEVLKSNEK